MAEAPTQNFTVMLSLARKRLEETKFEDPSAIFTSLGLPDLDASSQLLQKKLIEYQNANFHPLSAKTAELLAYLFYFQSDFPNWLKQSFRCLAPQYSIYLGVPMQTIFMSHLAKVPPTNVRISNQDSIPLLISAQLSSSAYLKSDKPSLLLTLNSRFPDAVTFSSLSARISHSVDGDISVPLLSAFEILPNKKKEFSISISQIGPGLITISGFSLIIGSVSISIESFKQSGPCKASIFPFQNPCKLRIESPDIGFTDTPCPVRLIWEAIPEQTEELNYSIELFDTPEFVNLSSNINKVVTPPKDFSSTAEISSRIECNVNMKVKWALRFASINAEYSSVKSLKVRDPFKVDNQLFDSDEQSRISAPFSLNSAHICGIVTQISSILPFESTVTDAAVSFAPGVDTEQKNQFQPISLKQGEEMSNVSYFRLSDKFKSGSLGIFTAKFHTKGTESEMVFSKALPEVALVPIPIKVMVNIPYNPLYMQRSSLKLSVERVKQEICSIQFSIADTKDFMLEGQTKCEFSLESGKAEFEVQFVPLTAGSLAFPKISFLNKSSSPPSLLWCSSPSVFVVYGPIKADAN